VSGPAVAAVDLAISPADWESLGFEVTGGVSAVGQVDVHLGITGAGPVAGWALSADDLGPPDIDGIQTRWLIATVERPVGVHPNTAMSIDHVVVTTPDVDRTFAALAGVGMVLRRERDAGSTRRPMRQGFFRHGEAIVEVVGPQQPQGDGPASLWGITVVVWDIDAAAALLGDRLGPVKDAVQPGRRIATVRAEAAGGTAVAFMTPRVRAQ